ARGGEGVEEGGFRPGKCVPGPRPARVDDGVAADDKARQAQSVGRQLDPGGILGGEAKEIGRGDARGEDLLPPDGEAADLAGVRPAGAEGGAAGAGIKGPAPALDLPPAGPGGARLGGGRPGGAGRRGRAAGPPRAPRGTA